ncbi:hypothetical protein B566_EDAN012986 [Ephemera danica]|nr:hypothetical protein B566_EDAN012986 [Ephemera danica]
MQLIPTNENEVIKTIHLLKKNAAPGLDEIPIYILQSCAKRIATPLTAVSGSLILPSNEDVLLKHITEGNIFHEMNLVILCHYTIVWV